MISKNEVRDAVQHFLARESRLDQFEEWLAERSWNMHRDSEPDVQKLIGRIQILLAEHGYDNMSEAALRRQLLGLVSDHVISMSPVNSESEPSFASNSTVQIPLFGMQVSTVSVS